MTLSFVVPFSTKIAKDKAVRVFQRNNKTILTGGVILKFTRKKSVASEEEGGQDKKTRLREKQAGQRDTDN